MSKLNESDLTASEQRWLNMMALHNRIVDKHVEMRAKICGSSRRRIPARHVIETVDGSTMTFMFRLIKDMTNEIAEMSSELRTRDFRDTDRHMDYLWMRAQELEQSVNIAYQAQATSQKESDNESN